MSKYEAGLITIADPGSDIPLLEEKTYQCVHCDCHFSVRKGGGVARGYCTRCAGFICGPACEKCIPVEQMLENIEAGRPLDAEKPTMISVPKLWLPDA